MICLSLLTMEGHLRDQIILILMLQFRTIANNVVDIYGF